MDFVQIAVSVKRGGYYYDFPSGKIYFVPPGGLADQGGESAPNLLMWVAGAAFGTAGLIGLARHARQPYSAQFFLTVVLLAAAVSSGLIRWLLRRGQKQFGQSVRRQCRALTPDPALREELRRGRGIYIKLAIYAAVLFCAAVVCLALLSQSPTFQLALLFLIFFDAGVMVITILQPIGKLSAYSRLKKQLADVG